MRFRRIFSALLPLILFASPVPEAAAARIGYIVSGGRRYANLNNIATNFNLRIEIGRNRFSMKGKSHEFVFTPDKKQAMFNGVQIMLNYSPFVRSGVPYVSELDYQNVLLPLMSRWGLKKHELKTIVIDPGHGGRDVGAEGRYTREKDFSLKLARKLRDRLAKAGYRVLMTRESDVTVELNTRAPFANRRSADLFISLHANAAANSSVYGIETYCLTPAGAASTNAGKVEKESYIGNRNNQNNFALAYLVHRSLLARTRGLDRGVRHARFMVLRDVQCPAILIEHGFISNPSEEKKLASDDYLNTLASAIASAVLNYNKALLRRND